MFFVLFFDNSKIGIETKDAIRNFLGFMLISSYAYFVTQNQLSVHVLSTGENRTFYFR